MHGLFVTGTDTGVGKTAIASALIRHLKATGISVGAYKPAVSGACLVNGVPCWDDVETLFTALGGTAPRERICPQTFKAPLAPPVAASAEGRSVDRGLLRTGSDWWREQGVEALIVEGAGGLLSPLSETDLVADVARDLGWPVLIVARRGLGTINHTLLTVEAARVRGLTIAGILMNEAHAADPADVSVTSNAAELRKWCPVPLLGEVPYLSAGDLLQHPPFRRIEWENVLGAHT